VGLGVGGVVGVAVVGVASLAGVVGIGNVGLAVGGTRSVTGGEDVEGVVTTGGGLKYISQKLDHNNLTKWLSRRCYADISTISSITLLKARIP